MNAPSKKVGNMNDMITYCFCGIVPLKTFSLHKESSAMLLLSLICITHRPPPCSISACEASTDVPGSMIAVLT
jgi:hypothetical protein